MPSARTLSLAVVPLLLHALAREVDRALGLVLRAEVEPASLLGELGRAADAEGLLAVARVVAPSRGGHRERRLRVGLRERGKGPGAAPAASGAQRAGARVGGAAAV